MKMKSLEAIPELKRSCVRRKRVSVQQHQVHPEMWSDLAAVTRARIVDLRPLPDGWCIYLNPEFTVESSEFSPEFTREARRCQGNWIKRMNKVLTKLCLHELADYRTRQLARNGVLLVNGHMIAPHDWKSMEAEINSHEPQKTKQPDNPNRSRKANGHDNSSSEAIFS